MKQGGHTADISNHLMSFRSMCVAGCFRAIHALPRRRLAPLDTLVVRACIPLLGYDTIYAI